MSVFWSGKKYMKCHKLQILFHNMFICGHDLLICSLVLVKPLLLMNKLVQHGQDLKQQGNIFVNCGHE